MVAKRRSTLCLLLLCFFSFFITPATTWAQQYSNLIIFGDSLSDTGNIAGAITPDLPAPYFLNRISNGLLAVDFFAASLGQDASPASDGGDNFAIVGGNILGDDLGDLSSQVDRYLDRQSDIADPQALYLIFMGGNDLRDLRGETIAENADARINQIMVTLVAQIQRLIDRGATQFLVANVADIGRIPQTLALETSDPGISARTSGYVQSFNQLLDQTVEQLGSLDDLDIRIADVFGALNTILDTPGAFGFSIVDVGCFDPNDSINPFDFEFDSGCDNPLFPLFQPDFSGYVFFDSIHPTTATHQLVANAIIEGFQAPPMEEPIDLVPLAPIILLLLDN